MPRIKPVITDAAAMKADFIARRGITKCPAAGRSEPARTIAPSPPPVAVPKPPSPISVHKPPPRDLGARPVLMWVPTSELHINQAYQRNISTKRGQTVIKDIVQRFQWPLFQPVTITQREEAGYWVIDGQHRMTAAQQIGIREIPAVLLDNLSGSQQALAFAGINGKRVSVNAYAIHHAMVAAEDPMSVRLAAVCAKSGVEIPRYPKMAGLIKPHETLAIAAIKGSMKACGDDAAIWALQLLRAVYPDESGTITASAIRLLSAFYATNADYPIHGETIEKTLLELDPETLRERALKVAATSPERIRWMIGALTAAYNGALPAGKVRLPAGKS